MNEIEKIIRVLSDMKLSFSQNYIQEAFDVSIEALREKAERSKGCEYCRGWDSRCGANYCPMCGRRLGVEHER
jgi:hypothetical protein